MDRADLLKIHSWAVQCMQVTRLMSTTEAWIKDIKQKDKRVRRAHALRTSQAEQNLPKAPTIRKQGESNIWTLIYWFQPSQVCRDRVRLIESGFDALGSQNLGEVRAKDPSQSAPQSVKPAILKRKSSGQVADKLTSEPAPKKPPLQTGQIRRKNSLSQPEIVENIPLKPTESGAAEPAPASTGPLEQTPVVGASKKEMPQMAGTKPEPISIQQSDSDEMDIMIGGEEIKNRAEEGQGTHQPIEFISHCSDSDSSMSLG